MGGVASYLFSWISPWTQGTTPDPATGLSERDRYLIQQSWEGVTNPRTLKVNAVELFMQLFTKFPHMRDYFPSFKNMDDEELRKSAKLRVHALGVMYQLSAYVQNTGDPETLVGLVQKVCASHADRGITATDFEELALMFVPYLKSLLGEKVTPDMEEAWSKLLAAQTALFKAEEKKRKS